MSDYAILTGDCLEVLKTLEDNSIDSLVTDPPAGISFMGKDWDSDKGGRDQWIAWMREVMSECLRVMKPGAHGLIWAIPRTSHWTATALEDAGFEIRDVVTHLFGSGFPKSLDISKAIDKAAGAEREVISKHPNPSGNNKRFVGVDGGCGLTDTAFITAPATNEAKQWQGWGTALKPASEHWILVRKPISEKTVAANVLKYGTGAINIDASRIGMAERDRNEYIEKRKSFADTEVNHGWKNASKTLSVEQYISNSSQGRFPANLILSCSPSCTEDAHDMFECPIAMLDEQSGISKSTSPKVSDKRTVEKAGNSLQLGKAGVHSPENSYADSGGASRFFYCAKASKADKNNGLDTKVSKQIGNRPGSKDLTGKFPDHDHRERSGNFHPTVKSTKLMSYLIKLITPPNGLVLDPFCGSGSTGVAAIKEGFDFIGIEKDSEYINIAEARLANAINKKE